jgi:zinc protease
MRKIFAALFALTLMAAPAIAKDAKPAPTSALIKAVDIPHEQFTLANGLRVIVHTDRKAPIVAVSVWYDVGSKHEPKGKTGFAHLFEHLMFNGSENSPGDFFEPLQLMGATDFNGTTWFDRTNYFENVPTGGLARTLWLESDRMGHLVGGIDQTKLTNQIGVVQNEKRQGDNQPYGMVEYAQIKAMIPADHPYGHPTIGSMGDLTGASLDDVKGWFRQHYGPNNAVLVLAGDIDAKAAKSLVEKYFGDIPRGPQQSVISVPVPTLSAPKSEVLKDRVANVRIYRNWVIPGLNDPEAVPLDVAGSVLGGLSSSRLDNALVRGEKLAVGVTAGAQIFAQLGFFEVTADVRPGVDPELVAKRLDEIIADFIAKGPSEDEVKRVATRQISGRIAGLEAVGGFGGKAVALAEGALYSNDADFYKKNLARYASVTPAEVTAAMQKWLTRPVYALRVVPGEREAYEETGDKAGGATFAPSYYRLPKAGETPLAPSARAAAEGAAAPAPAAGARRMPAPALGAITDLKFPKVQRAKLKNGMQVVYAMRNAVPITQVSLNFDAGNAADPRDRLGTQALMLGLLDEGAGALNSTQIAEAQERLGATISSSASMDTTTIGLFSLSANLAPSLALYADIIQRPVFDPKEVERLRNQQLSRVAAEMTSPGAIANRVLPPLLFGPDHPYGISFNGSGDPASIAKITRDDLVAFHRRWIRADKGIFFVVSDQPLGTIVKALNAQFGTWETSGEAGAKPMGAAPIAPNPRIILVNRPDSPQSMIMGGQVMPIKGTGNLETLVIANEVLGTTAILSRLDADLRETKGWSYGVRGSIVRMVGDVPYMISAPVQADKTGESIAALLADIKDFLGPKGVTPEEHARTIEGDIRELPGSFEVAGDVLGGMQRNVLYKRGDDYYNGLASRYRAMTAADLDKSIRAVLKPDAFLWVVVGDAKIVRPQLEKLGLKVEEMEIPQGK